MAIEGVEGKGGQAPPELPLQHRALHPGQAGALRARPAAQGPGQGQQVGAPVGEMRVAHMRPEHGQQPGPGFSLALQALRRRQSFATCAAMTKKASRVWSRKFHSFCSQLLMKICPAA